jgi:hypothetical protein
MVNMDDEIRQMQERFGPQGLQELAKLDGMGMALLYRLYLVSSIASNLDKFDGELAKNFYNAQSLMINSMTNDLDRLSNAFQDKHGEV